MELQMSLMVMGLHEVNSIYKLLSPCFAMPGTKITRSYTCESWKMRSHLWWRTCKSGYLQNTPHKAYLLFGGSLLLDCHYYVLLAIFSLLALWTLLLLILIQKGNLTKSVLGFLNCSLDLSIYFEILPRFSW